MTFRSDSEREPLLQASVVQPGAAEETNEDLKEATKVGPLEISRSTRYGILAGIWTATFLSSLNTTLVATLLPSISSEFSKSHQASWLGTAYLLATCTFTPLYGRLCNVLGRRGANQTAVFFAALGTAACGISGDMEVLIAARFVRPSHILLSFGLNADFDVHLACRLGWRGYLHHCNNNHE
ncbi:hypothetical protein SCP_0412510 [Sparassis crispa]|uniref:Major facilitator superfamily (MFS) profile domain-containing protein n=1 Tax=Sparassis crispa TaxID=139825 RepID=A0A401GL42_9APHY|nr:hypothetical protein SCP_0412510 [Sparassis crispa]GBE82864.1 hypothetical protein SCP_0412510 [Sparassis crispa]